MITPDDFTSLFQPISRSKFNSHIKFNPNENLSLIQYLERYILSKRNTIFRIPKNKKPVILLLSGGIDSVVVWYALLQTFRLSVYPIVIQDRVLDPQIIAVKSFSKLFREKFTKLYNAPYIIRSDTPESDVIKRFLPLSMAPDLLLKNYNIHRREVEANVFWGSNILFAYKAFYYAQLLYLTKKISIDTIFCGVNREDGLGSVNQTYTHMRLIMVSLMHLSNNTRFQFGSLFMDGSLGYALSKGDIVRYGHSVGLPLEKTYSCDSKTLLHCGRCLSCQSRMHFFRTNNIPDKTRYEAKNRVKRTAQITFHLIKTLVDR